MINDVQGRIRKFDFDVIPYWKYSQRKPPNFVPKIPYSHTDLESDLSKANYIRIPEFQIEGSLCAKIEKLITR